MKKFQDSGKINPYLDFFKTSPNSPISQMMNSVTEQNKHKYSNYTQGQVDEFRRQVSNGTMSEIIDKDGKAHFIRAEAPIEADNILSGFTPAGDAMELTQIGNDIANEDYGTAALASALFFIPGNMRNMLDKFGGVKLKDLTNKFTKNRSNFLSRQEFENTLRSNQLTESAIQRSLKEYDDKNLNELELGLFRDYRTNEWSLNPMSFTSDDFNIPIAQQSVVKINNNDIWTRDNYEHALRANNYNDHAIAELLKEFDKIHMYQATNNMIDTSPLRIFNHHVDSPTANQATLPHLKRYFDLNWAFRDIVNPAQNPTPGTYGPMSIKSNLSPEIKQFLAESDPILTDYINGKPFDDDFYKRLYDLFGVESPAFIEHMTWFQGANSPHISQFGSRPMYKLANGKLTPDAPRISAGKDAMSLIQQLPRYAGISETNTSFNSEMLKLKTALKNYGTNPGQYTVEPVPYGMLTGNSAQLQRIYLDEVLEAAKDHIDPKEYDLISEYINNRRNQTQSADLNNIISVLGGNIAGAPTEKQIPEFLKFANEYGNDYFSKTILTPFKKVWDKIKIVDPRYANVTDPQFTDRPSDLYSSLMHFGSYSPTIGKLPVAVVKHEPGGILR